MSSGLVLHHLEASRSIRIVWLLESLGLQYELKQYNRDPLTKVAANEPFSGRGLAAIHPIGRAPILEDNGMLLAETGSIIRHLLEHYNNNGKFPKPSDKNQAAIDQSFWIDFSEGSIMLHLVPLNYLTKGKANTKDGSSVQEKAIARGIYNDFKFFEAALEKNGGTLTGKELGPADYANLFGVEFFKMLSSAQTEEWRKALQLELGPHTQAWIKRCYAEPVYKNACAKEGDGTLTPENYFEFFKK